MVDVLWREGQQEAALRLEGLWNEYGRERPMSLLCAYVMGNFYKEADSGGFRSVCDAHRHVQPAESYSAGADVDTRLREISRLQQRARALETELAQRRQPCARNFARLEEALRAARVEAEAASRAKDEFLAMLGHELRNPLSPILTALELMKLRGDGRTAREQDDQRGPLHAARRTHPPRGLGGRRRRGHRGARRRHRHGQRHLAAHLRSLRAGPAVRGPRRGRPGHRAGAGAQPRLDARRHRPGRERRGRAAHSCWRSPATARTPTGRAARRQASPCTWSSRSKPRRFSKPSSGPPAMTEA